MTIHDSSAVFHDPTARRWRRFKRSRLVVAVAVALLTTTTVATVLHRTRLPDTSFKSSADIPAHQTRTATGLPSYSEKRAQVLGSLKAAEGQSSAPRHVSATTEMYAFMVDWDRASLESFKRNARHVDVLICEWLQLNGATGEITEGDAGARTRTLKYARGLEDKPRILALINNYDSVSGTWDSKNLDALLADRTSRARLIDRLQRFVERNQLDGVNIDFEDLPEGRSDDMVSFMCELRDRFAPLGLEITQSVPTDDPAYDYRALAQAADHLILMAYDEHSAGGEPGPVASQAWFEQVLEKRFAEVRPDKFVVAIGAYGYDWQEDRDVGVPTSFTRALAILRETGGHLSMDDASLNPTFGYQDNGGRRHVVWLLDAVTMFNHVSAVKRYETAGVAMWRLGAEDPTAWRVMDHRDELGSDTADSLSQLNQNRSVVQLGRGGILRVTPPRNGRRVLEYDPASILITNESVKGRPTPFIVHRAGQAAPVRGRRAKVAITFDDGPDPRFTPQVLDVLAKERATATFFVIGQDANAHPDVLRRIVDEGHQIGHHTYTHPQITQITPERLRLEISLSQRVFESRLHVRSLLFRPPLTQHIHPGNLDQASALAAVSDDGLLTCMADADPRDWDWSTDEQIVERSMEQVRNGSRTILLHDGGGDRTQTVRALPLLIRALRKEGYEPAHVSDLLGVPADQINRPIPAEAVAVATANRVTFEGMRLWGEIVYWLIIVALALGATRLVLISGLVGWSRLSAREHGPTRERKKLPSVTAIVPAYNEAKVIRLGIDSLLRSDYPKLRIFVIDDGSTDETSQVVARHYGDDPRVRLFRIPNGGKANALNYGIGRARASVIVTMDADSLLAPGAIHSMVRHFTDEKVSAVAGNVQVGNACNLLTRWQALEYTCCQNLDRRAFEKLNCITVVPGAVGAWRRKAVRAVGGFSDDTLAEDAELTVRLLKAGWRVTYEPTAYANTEAPESLAPFIRQRLRWVYGTLQTFWKHRGTMLRPRYRGLGLFAMPHALLYQVISPMIAPIVDVVMLAALVHAIVALAVPSAGLDPSELARIATYGAAFLLVDLALVATAMALEPMRDHRLLPWAVLQRFFYRQIMYVVAIRSMRDALRGAPRGWNKLERSASCARTTAAGRVRRHRPPGHPALPEGQG